MSYVKPNIFVLCDMKTFSILTFLTLVFSFNISFAKENLTFVEGIIDLPVFKNMNNLNENLLIFDTNQGRLIKAEIKGKEELSEAKSFYEEILPNLGWVRQNEDTYIRGKELMLISYIKKGKELFITFRISPN